MEVFKSFDKNNDGQIDKNELLVSYDKLKHDPSLQSLIDGVITRVDMNANTNIDYTEFLLATINYKQELNEEVAAKIFDTVNSNKSNFINRNQLSQFLNLTSPENEWELQCIMREVDENKDGVISFEEFKLMMKRFMMEDVEKSI